MDSGKGWTLKTSWFLDADSFFTECWKEKKKYFERGFSYLVYLKCLCVCDTTYWILLWDQKMTSFISLDSESFALGQQLQGGISTYFPPWNPSCLKKSKETLVLLQEGYPWLQAEYWAPVCEVVGWSFCGICCEQLCSCSSSYRDPLLIWCSLVLQGNLD